MALNQIFCVGIRYKKSTPFGVLYIVCWIGLFSVFQLHFNHFGCRVTEGQRLSMKRLNMGCKCRLFLCEAHWCAFPFNVFKIIAFVAKWLYLMIPTAPTIVFLNNAETPSLEEHIGKRIKAHVNVTHVVGVVVGGGGGCCHVVCCFKWNIELTLQR